MIDFIRFSSKYLVRRMNEQDAELILSLCRGNPLFYQYANAEPTLEQVLGDLRISPPGVDMQYKYYLGFFDGKTLVAVMDIMTAIRIPRSRSSAFLWWMRLFKGGGMEASL